MLFKETLKGRLIIKPEKITGTTLKLDPKRKLEIKRIVEALKIKEIYIDGRNQISQNDLYILAIDNLIKKLEEMPEDEALEFLHNEFN